jgi:imidazolonepropionase-like amidohydrolase
MTGAAPPPARTVVRAARLLDGVSATPLEQVAVHVEDGAIAALETGASAAADVAPGVELVDLGDVTLLPGLIDLHAHLTAWANRWRRPTYDEGTRYALQAAANCRAALDAGVTTIRDAGTFGDVAVATRDAVAEGVIEGPRILASRQAVTIPGSLGPDAAVVHLGRVEGWMVEVSGADAMRDAVRSQVKRGADWIKLYYERGDWTTAELEAAVDAAHSVGVRVMCHANRPTAIKAAIVAGVDTLEHGMEADEDDLAAMAEQGIGLVPTLFIVENRWRAMQDARVAAAQPGYRYVARVRDVHREAFRRALALGVRVGTGVDPLLDEGAVPFAAVVEELRIMVELGMAPSDALRAATSGAAELLGLADELGAVRAGLAADLIAVAGDPLGDVGALRDVRFAMRAGRIVRCAPVAPRAAPVARAGAMDAASA